MRTLTTDDRILADPKPAVVVTDLADDKLTVTVQAWTSTANFTAVQRDVADNLPTIIWPTIIKPAVIRNVDQ